VVRQRVNLGPADLTVRPGDALHLSGVVQPARGGVVALQRLGPGGAWLTGAQARLVERTGGWELGWRVRTARPLTLRVRVGARPRLGLGAGISRVVLLNAR
jgi:hypothetical protein